MANKCAICGAEDIGLVAFTQVDYKFWIFGKSTRACVYRIADLRAYEFEKEEVKGGEENQKCRNEQNEFALRPIGADSPLVAVNIFPDEKADPADDDQQ